MGNASCMPFAKFAPIMLLISTWIPTRHIQID